MKDKIEKITKKVREERWAEQIGAGTLRWHTDYIHEIEWNGEEGEAYHDRNVWLYGSAWKIKFKDFNLVIGEPKVILESHEAEQRIYAAEGDLDKAHKFMEEVLRLRAVPMEINEKNEIPYTFLKEILRSREEILEGIEKGLYEPL
jgi:hypothetical protein